MHAPRVVLERATTVATRCDWRDVLPVAGVAHSRAQNFRKRFAALETAVEENA
jgi:hypothetical protein